MGRITALVVLAAIVAAAAALYSPAADYSAVWDDREVLRHVSERADNDPFEEAFLKPIDRLYRPLWKLTFMLPRRLTGVEGAGALRLDHIVSIAIFLLVIPCFYVFVNSLARDRLTGLSATFLYAMHPVHAGVAAWICNRSTHLAAAFVFVALALYLHARRNRGGREYYSATTASLVFFIAALMSKESAVVAPALVMAIELTFPESGGDSFLPRVWKGFVRMLPFLAVTALYFHVRTLVTGSAAQAAGYHGGSLGATLMSVLPVFADYVGMLLAPVHLCAIYRPEIYTSFGSPPVIYSALFLGAMLAAALALYRRAPFLSFAILWFFITLAPSSNIIPIPTLKSTRFLIMPALSVCFAAGWAIPQLFRKILPWKFALPAAGAVVLACGLLPATAAAPFRDVWKNEMTLWKSAAECAPGSHIAHNNYGIALHKKGNRKEALEEFERAAALRPGQAGVRKNIAQMYAERGKYRRALAEYRTALALDPDDPEIYQKISLLYMKLGRAGEARAWFERYISMPCFSDEEKASMRHMKLKLFGNPGGDNDNAAGNTGNQ